MAAGALSDAELRQEAIDHVWMHCAAWEDVTKPDGFKVITGGQGCRITDAQGRSFLDACSGLWCVNVGYGRAEIGAAMAEQCGRIHYASSAACVTPPAARLADRLAAMAPGSLSRCFFVNGGTDAVESAIKLARQYHYLNGQPGRYKVIARRYSYHGGSLGVMALSTGPLVDRNIFEPLPAGGRQVPGPNCYRCDYKMEHPGCGVFCARTLESLIQWEGPETVSAIIAEPISNSGGVVVPPDEYWPMLREICDKYGILLIADEVITGFGRTGKMFGIEHWGVVPDIITLAKGLASAYAPIGAAMVREEVAAKFRPGRRETFQHIVTFGGHAVAAAAAMANLDILEREGLVENAAAMGRRLQDGLTALQATHPIIGQVRGRGLMVGVEIVRDRATRAQFAPGDRPKVRYLIKKHLDAAGVFASPLGGPGDVIPLLPPLVISPAEADELLAALDRTLAKVEQEFGIAR